MNENWFSKREYNFSDAISSDGNILSSAFLLAAEDFIRILDTQTNPLFIPIKKKYRLDLEQIMKVYTSNPEIQVKYLVNILEKEEHLKCTHVRCNHASHGILMLTRAFCFIYRTFNNALTRDDMELNEMFQESYYQTLGKFHDQVSRKIFYAAMGMCPYKDTFFSQLQRSDTLDNTKKDAKIYFEVFKRARDSLVKMCRDKGWEICE